MSAFGSPWKDIDDTNPGTPYVVDNDGWGWLFIFIIAAIPFLLVGSAICYISSWICTHPILAATIYLIISFLFGIIFYSRFSMKHRVCGIIATVVTMLPLEMGVGFYAIPYTMLEGSFFAFFDWVLVTAFLFGIIFFIFSICNLLKNGLIHLVIGVVFLALAYLFVRSLILSESDVLSKEAIKQIYGF